MFEPTSRYYELEDRTLERDGRHVVYKARRFVPQRPAGPAMGQVKVEAGDRPDLLATRIVQQPELFWRLCDAAGVLHPRELTRRVGRKVDIHLPMPGS